MNVGDIKHHISEGKFNHWYIFTGEEVAIMKIYIKMISEKSGLPIVYYDKYADAYGEIKQSGLIAEHYLYVIMDDKDFTTNEKAQSTLDNIKEDIVILYYSTCDKRLKFWKNFLNLAVEFEHLSEAVLVKYIQKDVKLNDKNCKRLIEVCENDYSRILLELDKLKNFDNKGVNSAFEHLMKAGVIYVPPKDAIFDFVNAVLERNGKKALDLLEQSYAVGEANMTLISVMYNSFRNLLQVQTCGNNDISKSTGLTGWQIKNVKPYVDNYSTGELIRALRMIQRVESGIKTGTISDEISTQYLVVNII